MPVCTMAVKKLRVAAVSRLWHSVEVGTIRHFGTLVAIPGIKPIQQQQIMQQSPYSFLCPALFNDPTSYGQTPTKRYRLATKRGLMTSSLPQIPSILTTALENNINNDINDNNNDSRYNHSSSSSSSSSSSNTIGQNLTLLSDLLALQETEQAWQLYQMIKSHVPVTYRIELARLLQRAAINFIPAEECATRLLNMLKEWPLPILTDQMTDKERKYEIKRVMQARRGCLNAYLAVASAKDVDMAESLVNDMLLNPSNSPSNCIVSIANSNSNCYHVETSQVPTVATLQNLIRLRSRLGQPDSCNRWIKRFKQEFNINADTICWHWLVNAWLQAGHPQNAVTIAISHMSSANVKVYQQTWYSLLKSFTFNLQFEEKAQKIPQYEDIERKRAAITLLEYLDRICGGKEAGKYQRVVLAGEQNHANGNIHDNTLFIRDEESEMDFLRHSTMCEYPLNESVLAMAMGLALNIEEIALARRFRGRANMLCAQRVFAVDPTATPYTVSTIALKKEVYYWCYAGNYKNAEYTMLQLPLERRYQPKLIVAIMKAARRIGRPEEAVRLFKTARESGLLRPDMHMWTCLIAAYAEQMDLTAAQQAFYEMRKSGISAGVVGYTTLLVAYGKCGELKTAERILQTMDAEATMTLEQLGLEQTNGQSFRDNAVVAEKAPRPNTITRCALADAFAKCNDIDRTIEILLQNEQANHNERNSSASIHAKKQIQISNTFSLNTIMSALNRSQRPHDVLRLWWTAIQSGASNYDQTLHTNVDSNNNGSSSNNHTTKQSAQTVANDKTWNFGTLAITLDTCAWHNLGHEGEQVWRAATRELLIRQGWNASPLRHEGRRVRLTRHCWYSYIGLLGRTGRVHDIPHALVTMIENGRLPNKLLLLHAFAFLVAHGEEAGIQYVSQVVRKLGKRLNGPIELILPTTEEAVAYFQNRQ